MSTRGADRSQRSVLANSAVMAAGTVVSRLSGFARSMLLVAALGSGLHADLFNIANTVPNMVYILLAGGIFNAVLVPQLVRAMKNDADAGEAYTNRIITLAALFLGAVTILLVVAAPLLMDVFLGEQYDDPALADQRASAIAFARYCLPQVFFYAMFVLVGQVLNARGRFGPMMWAPIANNLLTIVVLVGYLVGFGAVDDDALDSAYTPGQEALLGLGSTLGIVAQFLVLVPYLRKAGFTYRPRTDFRNAGLGHTLRLGLWTVLFVVVNQIAYAKVVELASTGAAEGGTGYTIYSYTFLIVMVPHSVVTVSLATAILPRLADLASEGEHLRLGRSLASTLRSALAAIVPFAALLPVLAPDAARVLFGFGAGAGDADRFVPSLSLFSIGLVLFTVHYLMLRGFYALEQTRRVFLIQCVIATTNVVAAIWLVGRATPDQTAPALVLAYAAAYAVGSVLSLIVLRGTLGSLDLVRTLRFGVRLAIVVAVATGAAVAVSRALPTGEGPLPALGRAAVVGTVDLGLVLLGARLLRVSEITRLVDTVAARLNRG